MPRKRIAVVTNRFYPQFGGAEHTILYTLEELSKHCEIDVLTPLRDRDPKRETLDGMRIFRYWDAHNPWNRLPNLQASLTMCPSVFHRVLLGGYDLVHCFPAVNRNNILALAAARLRGIPAFLTNYDLFDYSQLLSGGDFDAAAYERLKIGARQKDHLKKFNGIFTIAERETRLLEAVNPNTFLSTVPIKLDEWDEEHDTAAFRKKYDIAPDVDIVLCLSRVAQVKGQDMLLKAVPSLRRRAKNFVVLIVGKTDFEPEFVEGMRTFIAENDLGGIVKLTGGLPREDVLAAVKACAVHVLPMRFMNSGAVVVETWAAHRPVIQSTGIDPVYVEEGVNGHVFDKDDPEELAAKIEQVLQDPAAQDEMGRKGRRLVESKFLYSHLVDQYLTAYRELG